MTHYRANGMDDRAAHFETVGKAEAGVSGDGVRLWTSGGGTVLLRRDSGVAYALKLLKALGREDLLVTVPLGPGDYARRTEKYLNAHFRDEAKWNDVLKDIVRIEISKPGVADGRVSYINASGERGTIAIEYLERVEVRVIPEVWEVVE